MRWLNRLYPYRESNIWKDIFYFAYFPVFSFLGVFSLYWFMSITHHSYGADYSIYLDAYTDARGGINPYLPFSVGSSFVNHPIVLILVRIFFFLGRNQSLMLWSGMSIGAWLGCLVIGTVLSASKFPNATQESFDFKAFYFLAIFFVFGPFLETIATGQVNTLALFFILLSFILSELEKPGLAGFALGLSILLKTSPVLILIYFLIIRRYKIVIVTLGTLLLLTLLSQIPFKENVIGHFFSILPDLSNEIHPSRYNHSLSSVTIRLLGGYDISSITKVIPVFNKVILGALIIVLAWTGWRPAHHSRYVRMLLFACFQILVVIFSPLVWYHHYVFLLFPLLMMISDSSMLARISGILALTAFQLDRFFESKMVWFPWPALFGMFLLLISTYALFLHSSKIGSFQKASPSHLARADPTRGAKIR